MEGERTLQQKFKRFALLFPARPGHGFWSQQLSARRETRRGVKFVMSPHPGGRKLNKVPPVPFLAALAIRPPTYSPDGRTVTHSRT
jgi:hypothetical protein